jgi:peptide-methionine (R)-S-oxide reductase
MKRREFLRSAALMSSAPIVLPLGSALGATASLAPTDVPIAQFGDDGKKLGVARVAKVVKSDAEWHAQLSALAFAVTRKGDTEIAFTGKYWDLHDAGIFRCLCCDTALFSSEHKFDSGTGWPSFWQPIAPENVSGRGGRKPTERDTEVTCQRCDAHLGDVFTDGPRPTGLRYCIDSIALRFVKRA